MSDDQDRPKSYSSVAKRVHSELQRLAGFNKNQPIYREWARAWEIESRDPQQPALVAPEVARRLTLLTGELDELEQQLAVRYPQLSAKNTTHQIHRFRLILARSLEALGSPWGNVQPELTPDLMQCLSIWDELTADDEPAPDSHELHALLRAIFDARVAAAELSDMHLREALLSILAQLERAILDYSVGGPDAFNAAFRQAFSELIRHQDIIRDNLDADEVGNLRKVWEEFQRVCAPLIFADTLLTAGSRFQHLGATVWKLIQGNG